MISFLELSLEIALFYYARLVINGVLISLVLIHKKVVDHSLVDKKSICIIPNSEKSRWAESERTKLRSLYRNITQIQRETGLQETYLGFPFVEGHISKRWYVRGPLVLFPVSIIYKNEGKLPG